MMMRVLTKRETPSYILSMPTHYQTANGGRPYFDARFGLACPQVAAIVRPGDQGVFVRRPRADQVGNNGSAARFEAVGGRWGLIPLFSKDGLDEFTYEARGETANQERNFHQPWKRGHRCVILADALFQPGEGDTVVRVARADDQPLALAGLWNGWRSPAGQCVESFALLTLAAPDRPEQRRTAILRDAWLDDWLHCPVEETAAYLRPYADDKLVRQTLASA